MILPFSTKLNGKETFFVERIHKGIRINYLLRPVDPIVHYPPNYNFVAKDKLPPKLHTLREDKNDRWQVGTMIDFFINVRQKNMFCFAPRLTVMSTQVVEIIHTEFMNDIILTIDKKRLNLSEMEQFARNDGFDNLYEFIAYFNKDCVRKLIHWTDLRY